MYCTYLNPARVEVESRKRTLTIKDLGCVNVIGPVNKVIGQHGQQRHVLVLGKVQGLVNANEELTSRVSVAE